MAEVFISYSRKDKDFVHRLGDSLVEHNREAWVDWKDIPLTAEWQQEILRNIEAADNFIFVISPDSVASVNCRKEVEHAAANNKKMLPLFYRPVPDDSVPETLNRFQRLDFDEPEKFEAKFDALIKALDTDLPWTQAHTRLLTRAKEWERMARDSSFLFRGKDLREAEQWMAKSSDREPKPTALQSQYIVASRQAATKIQRIIIGAVAVAFLIAVALAIYAFMQKNVAQRETQVAQTQTRLAQTNETEAKKQKKAADVNAAEATRQKQVAQQNEAEAVRQKGIAQDETAKAVLQAKITNARRLATESLYRFGYSADDLAISGALALESLKAYPTTEGMKALSQVLRLIPVPPKIIPGAHHGVVESLAFSRDGRWMASGGEDQVILWDLAHGMKRQVLQPPQPWRPTTRALAFSDDGHWLAIGSYNSVCVWDLEAGKPAQDPIPHGYVVRSLTFSPDGHYLATSTFGEGPGRGVRLLQEASQQWKEVKPFPQGEGPFIGVQFLKNGALAVADKSGVWITDPGLLAHNEYKFGDGGPCYSLAIGGDGSTLAALCDKGLAIATLNDDSYAFTSSQIPVITHNTSVNELRISTSPSADFAVVDDIVYAVRSRTANQLLAAAGFSCCASIAFRPDGKAIAGGLNEGSIAVWPTGQGNQSVPVPGVRQKVSGLSISPDEALVATVEEEGVLSLFDISDPDRIRRVANATIGHGLQQVFFSPRGQILVITAADHLFFVESRSSKILAGYSRSGNPPLVGPSVDGRTIYVLDRDGVRGCDAETGMEHLTIKGSFENFRLSPDGRYLSTSSRVVGNGHHYIDTTRVWNLSNGIEVAWEETGRQGSDPPPTRSPTGGSQSLLRDSPIWLAPNEKKTISPDAVLRIEFNRYSPTLVLKEADSQRPVASFEHESDVTDAVFSPRGRWLVTASEDGSVRLWPLQVSDLAERACKMLPRNLTPDEWRTLKMGGPYRKTCANLP